MHCMEQARENRHRATHRSAIPCGHMLGHFHGNAAAMSELSKRLRNEAVTWPLGGISGRRKLLDNVARYMEQAEETVKSQMTVINSQRGEILDLGNAVVHARNYILATEHQGNCRHKDCRCGKDNMLDFLKRAAQQREKP